MTSNAFHSFAYQLSLVTEDEYLETFRESAPWAYFLITKTCSFANMHLSKKSTNVGNLTSMVSAREGYENFLFAKETIINFGHLEALRYASQRPLCWTKLEF